MSADTQASRFPPFPADYRAGGVLLHVTSLPSPYGIGDLGPPAFAWVDCLCEAGQTWWQALPVGPTGYADSPYQSLSSFAGNGLLISPTRLIEDGLLLESDCEGQSFPAHAVDYDAVITFKNRLLDTAWLNFKAGARRDLGTAYENFRHDHARWLHDYALFRALRVKYRGAYYLEWPIELVQRTPSALAQAESRTGARDRQGLFRPIPIVPPSGSTQTICAQQRHPLDWRPAFFRFSGFQRRVG